MSNTSDVLRPGGVYDLAGLPNSSEIERIQAAFDDAPRPMKPLWLNQHIRATPTGEKRPPRKGEWYLSGAIIAAYRAPNDLSTAFHIARLVRIDEVVDVKIRTIPAGDD